MTRHAILMQKEVTFADISEAHHARLRAYSEHEKRHRFEVNQEFESVRSVVCPQFYDRELDMHLATRGQNAKDWFCGEDSFKRWSNSEASSDQILWLEGIPGAGKCNTLPGERVTIQFSYRQNDTRSGHH